MLALTDPLFKIRGIGPKFFDKFSKFGLITIKDLLWHFPTRYEDFSEVKKIADLKINESATIQGVISEIKLKRTWRRRMFIVQALVADDSGSIKAVWFNQKFLLSILKKGKRVNLAGKIVSDPDSGICMSHPIYEIVNREGGVVERELGTKHTGRLVPVYPETRRVTSKMIRAIAAPALDDLEEIKDSIPEYILDKFGFPEINTAIRNIHFPPEKRLAREAKKRFAFEDLFLLQLTNIRQRLQLSKEKAHGFEVNLERVKYLISNLPFELTEGQKKSLWEVLRDLREMHPMNRLLQGDVGSGKTIVAAIAAIIVASEGRQSAFMAPTEVLAKQHFETLKKFFGDFENGIGLITSSESQAFYGDNLESELKKNDFIKKVAANEIKIIIGTHALIQKSIRFRDLAFVVVDEQHRFGVRQRRNLLDQTPSVLPHFLSMSATPIPRTLSLTVFGDLDLSIIDELPKGRRQIITKVVAPANRGKAYAFIRGQVRKGRQAFVICPRIDKAEEEKLAAGQKRISPQKLLQLEIRNVNEEFDKLSKDVFPDLRVRMLHGKMKSADKMDVMNWFKRGEIDILVSTSVVEVGVDVPNATIMMVEAADRFGLAQLYQFRGRVGRGGHQSFCFLFSDSAAVSTWKRLKALIDAKNGFELAEKDLEIRGPGEFLGDSQTGMPDLAMKAVQNPELVKLSRESAEEILRTDPDMDKHHLLKERIEQFEKAVHLE